MVNLTLVIMCLLGWACSVVGAQPQILVEERESISPEVITLPLEVPTFSLEHQVRLSLEARVDAPSLLGSNPWLVVLVNGNQLISNNLLNKPVQFVTRGGMDLRWHHFGRWRILYSPDFEVALTDQTASHSLSEQDHPYRFVWDITNYVQPGANELKLIHHQILPEPNKMVFRNIGLEVGLYIAPPPAAEVTPAPTGPVPAVVAAVPPRFDLQAEAKDGTVTVQVGEQHLAVRTRVSLPAGQWREARATGPTTWAAGPCQVSRQITVKDDHVQVADTFTNTTDQLIGVMVEHHLELPAPPEACYLAGLPVAGESGDRHDAANPSVFAELPDMGVGLVAEDDIFRVHARLFRTSQSLGLGDDRLGLPPGGSHTLEWSIYPAPQGDYWRFVNAVRRHWGVNFTIPGAFIFNSGMPLDLSSEEYGKWMHDRGVKYICGGIAKYKNGFYAHGTGILNAPEFVERERTWVSRMSAADPDLVPIAYFHAQICSEENSRGKYADSRLFDVKGQVVDYPYRYELPLFVPTLENSYGQALWGFLDCLIDDIKVKGIYWDEMSYSSQQYAYNTVWDGCSVLINRTTHALEGQYSSVPLLIQPLSLKIVDHIRDKGLFFMGNSQAHTRTMMRQQLVRFVETGTYSALTKTHLACPLGLANHIAEDLPADSATQVRELLHYGAIYYGHYYSRPPSSWNFVSVMYPITPEQIGPGYVLGKERIHTTVSGRFGFPDGAAADVYVVDAQGDRVTEGMVTEVREGERRIYELRMPSDHFAILVRQGD